MDIHSIFNRPPNKGMVGFGVSKTAQEFKDDCDISHILKRFTRTGVAPVRVGTFADVAEIGDFRDVMNRVQAAISAFEQQPSNIRARFAHDPRRFYEWLMMPENRSEAVKLGLASVTESSDDVGAIKAGIDKLVSLAEQAASKPVRGETPT